MLDDAGEAGLREATQAAQAAQNLLSDKINNPRALEANKKKADKPPSKKGSRQYGRSARKCGCYCPGFSAMQCWNYLVQCCALFCRILTCNCCCCILIMDVCGCDEVGNEDDWSTVGAALHNPSPEPTGPSAVVDEVEMSPLDIQDADFDPDKPLTLHSGDDDDEEKLPQSV